MAADKITIDLDLNARRAQREVAKLQKQIDKLGKGMSGALGGSGRGGVDKVRALGTGLSKATVRADEFNKSLEASNARVIAFGASAGLIMQVDRALKAMVSSAIKVEKAFMDVKVVMDGTNKELERFGKGMFKVAKETAQSFDTVSEAATELARQGLGMEKTLSRTKDALILTRLTGMNAADAVKSLTAAVNSFNKEGATSTKVVNAMAKVDAAFAVSSEDLAKSISRVGASAQSAGVSMNELMAITTSVQQRTARGGAVIGNAFKTIFTRIQRSDVQKRLKDFGVATSDMNGQMLNGIQVIQNLADKFDTLSKSQQASISESVAGVFQVNILKAAMADLSNSTSDYGRALKAANSATDEAYKRNEQLNQTLDSLVNRTLANLTQAGAALGGGMFEPAIRKVLGTVNSAIESFGKGGAMEGAGETVGKGIIAGIGNFISGPGIVLALAAFGKLTLNLGKFATTALKDFMGLNTAVKQRAALEEMVIDKLKSEPQYIQQIINKEKTLVQIQREMLGVMELQTLERAQMQAIAGPVATAMYGAGARVTPSGYGAFGRGPGKAGGFIPNFASAGAERAAAAAGGYTAGAIRTMNQPGVGSVMYNSAETVKHFPGMSQAAIMPPKNSPAGAGYKAAFNSAHGFNPYAASGFVPSFAKAKKSNRRTAVKGDVTLQATNDMGVLLAEAGTTSPLRFTNSLSEIPKLQDAMRESTTYKHLFAGNKEGKYLDPSTKIRVRGMPVVSMFPMSDAEAASHAEGQPRSTIKVLQGALNRYKNQVGSKLWGIEGGGTVGDDFNVNRLSKGTAGDIFEEAVRASLMDGDIDRRAAFDYSGERYAPKGLIKYMRREGAKNLALSKSKIEAKIGPEAATDGNLPKKVVNDAVGVGDKLALTKNKILKAIQDQTGLKAALGFVPNFSPLTSAIGREMAAGVPASAIRIGSSPALRSAGNPGGVGVYNTIDEPGGLGQGINRAKGMGINPKTHGAAGGFVPNFISGSVMDSRLDTAANQRMADKTAKAAMEQGKAAKTISAGADRIMMAAMFFNMAASGLGAGMGLGAVGQARTNAFANITSMAAVGGSMGIGAGAPGIAIGALVGGGIGALTSMSDLSKSFGEGAEAARMEELSQKISEVVTGMGQLATVLNSMETLTSDTPTKRLEKLNMLQLKHDEILKSLAGDEEFIVKARESYIKRMGGEGIFQGKKFSEFTPTMIGSLMTRIATEQARVEQELSIGNQFEAFNNLVTPTAENTRELARSIFKPGIQRDIADVNIGGLEGVDVLQDILGNMGQFEEGFPGLKELLRMAPQLTRLRELLKVSGERAFSSQIDNVLKDIQSITPGYRAGIEEGRDYGAATNLSPGSGRKVNATKLRANIETISRIIEEGRNIIPLLADPEFFRQRSAADTGSRSGASRGMIQEFLAGQVSYHRGQAEGATRRGASARAAFGRRRGDIQRDLSHAQRVLGIQEGGVNLINLRKELIEASHINLQNLEIENALSDKNIALEKNRSLAVADFVDAIRKSEMGEIEKIRAEEDFRAAYGDLTSLTEDQLRLRRKDLNNIDSRGTAEEQELKFITAELDNRRKINKAYDDTVNDVIKKYQDLGVSLDKNTEQNIKEYLEGQKFQIGFERAKIAGAGIRARTTASGLRELRSEGYGITSQEIAMADRTARRADIREGKRGRATFGEVFGEVNAYGKTDYMLEFEDGMINVAENMKNSFSDAFKSIASGAASGKEAIVAFADSILNSISSVSANMATNILFSKIGGNAQGGYIPRYQSGGLVTGGSGVKDDVPALMSGGEYVIRKSAVNKIGLGTLNAINGYSNGGSIGQGDSLSMTDAAKFYGISAAASMASGYLNRPAQTDKIPQQNYGLGRSEHGYLGGADPDAGGSDAIRGGGRRASVSLNKAFVYYRRDPVTGQLVSERARPTEGRFETSSLISTMGLLREDDPQTARMFSKEQKMASYQDYLIQEKQRRSDVIKAHNKQKRGRMMSAYMNAAMLVGGQAFMGGAGDLQGSVYSRAQGAKAAAASAGNPNFSLGHPENPHRSTGGAIPSFAGGGRVSPAMLMGGEYVMSPDAVRTYGVNFMSELNRGNVPGYANGGLVGGGAPAGSGVNTNNVKININIDKSGNAEIGSSLEASQGDNADDRDINNEVENNRKMAEMLQGVVLKTIVDQQRPGGLLQDSN